MSLPAPNCSNLQDWYSIKWAMRSVSPQTDLVMRGLLHVTSYIIPTGSVGSQSRLRRPGPGDRCHPGVPVGELHPLQPRWPLRRSRWGGHWAFCALTELTAEWWGWYGRTSLSATLFVIKQFLQSTAATVSTSIPIQAALRRYTGLQLASVLEASPPISSLTSSFIVLWWGERGFTACVHFISLCCHALWQTLLAAGCRTEPVLWLLSPFFPSLWIFPSQINQCYYFLFLLPFSAGYFFQIMSQANFPAGPV